MKFHGLFISLVVLVLLGACSFGAGKAAPDLTTNIAASLAMPDRPEADVKRDSARKPADTLKFSAIGPGDVVADLGAGGGYYTRLLSALVGPDGRVIAQNPPSWVENFKSIKPGLEKLTADRANVTTLSAKMDDLGFDPGSLDAVTMMLIYHDTVNLGADRNNMLTGIYAALKPDGVFLVTDHHALTGTGTEATNTLHRIDADVVMTEALAAGFVLLAQSDTLQFTNDDRKLIVFDPAIRGKTDRFVYLFGKAN